MSQNIQKLKVDELMHYGVPGMKWGKRKESYDDDISNSGQRGREPKLNEGNQNQPPKPVVSKVSNGKKKSQPSGTQNIPSPNTSVDGFVSSNASKKLSSFAEKTSTAGKNKVMSTGLKNREKKAGDDLTQRIVNPTGDKVMNYDDGSRAFKVPSKQEFLKQEYERKKAAGELGGNKKPGNQKPSNEKPSDGKKTGDSKNPNEIKPGDQKPSNDKKPSSDPPNNPSDTKKTERKSIDLDTATKVASAASGVGKSGSQVIDSMENIRKTLNTKVYDTTSMSDKDLQTAINRMNMEKNYNSLMNERNNSTPKGMTVAKNVLAGLGSLAAATASALTIASTIKKFFNKD